MRLANKRAEKALGITAMGASATTLGVYVPKLMRSARRTRYAFAIAVLSVAIGNALALLCHSVDQPLFDEFIEFARPAVNISAQYILAIDQMNYFFRFHHISSRAPVFNSILILNIAIYLVNLPSVVCLVFADFAEDGAYVASSIGQYLEKQGRSLGAYGGFHFVMWLVFFLLLFTDVGYSNFLFDHDFYFAVMAFFFGESLYCLVVFLVCLSAYLQLRQSKAL